MQNPLLRYFTAYTITTLIYAAVLGALFYTQTHYFSSINKPKEKTIQMSFSTFVPVVAEPVLKPVEKVEEVIPPEEPSQEEQIQKEVIKKEVVPEPIVRKELPEPVVKKIIETKKQVEKKVIQKPIKKVQKKKKSTAVRAASKRSQSTPAQKNKFWNALRQKIDRNKSYPRIAKKRHMQGRVKVRFTILSNGTVSNISVEGPKIFHNSAQDAIKRAFPIDTSNAPVSFPKTITIPLQYELK